MVEGMDDRDHRPPPINKTVKKGATIGMVVGWLVALIYVFASFPIPFGFQPNLQSRIDSILLIGPVLGAVVGGALGWFTRDSNWFKIAREITNIEGAVLPPENTNRRAVKWGWKAGTVAGIGLGQYYIANNSPLGFYTGSIVLVFELIVPLCAGVGACLGAGIGWRSTNKIGGVDPP
jgi:hypothetical protein